MLKTYTLNLTGRDTGVSLLLTELPALVADRCARSASPKTVASSPWPSSTWAPYARLASRACAC